MTLTTLTKPRSPHTPRSYLVMDDMVAMNKIKKPPKALKRRMGSGGAHAQRAAAATLLGLAAFTLLLNEGGTSGNTLRRALSTSEEFLVLGFTASKMNTTSTPILFDTELRPNPNPTTLGCENHFYDNAWHSQETIPQPVPPGSKFQLNNDFIPILAKTNLNIMVMGDSVGENIFFMLEKAFGLQKEKREVGAWGTNRKGKPQEKIVVNKLSADRGGGYLGFARVLDLFQNAHQGKEWIEWDPQHFRDFVAKHGKVDILLYRTPWPWLTIVNPNIVGNIVTDDYRRIMEVIHQQLQPKAVIMATSAVNNNAVRDGFVRMRKDNQVIRSFVDSYIPPASPNDGVQSLVLMDWEKLTDALIVANGETMSIPPEKAFNHYVTGDGVAEPYRYSAEGNKYFFPQLTAMACTGSVQVDNDSRIGTCPADKRGLVSPDGMHWCSSTVGPRTAGGTMCLINCILAKESSSQQTGIDGQVQAVLALRKCQDKCNDLFMNMDTKFGEGHLHHFLDTRTKEIGTGVSLLATS